MRATAWTAVMEAVATLSAATEHFAGLHAGGGVLDTAADLAMLCVVFLPLQQLGSGAFAVRDDQSGLE